MATEKFNNTRPHTQYLEQDNSTTDDDDDDDDDDDGGGGGNNDNDDQHIQHPDADDDDEFGDFISADENDKGLLSIDPLDYLGAPHLDPFDDDHPLHDQLDHHLNASSIFENQFLPKNDVSTLNNSFNDLDTLGKEWFNDFNEYQMSSSKAAFTTENIFDSIMASSFSQNHNQIQIQIHNQTGPASTSASESASVFNINLPSFEPTTTVIPAATVPTDPTPNWWEITSDTNSADQRQQLASDDWGEFRSSSKPGSVHNEITSFSFKPEDTAGFDKFTEEQRYAVGAISAAVINHFLILYPDSHDFFEDFLQRILEALCLKEGTVAALKQLPVDNDLYKALQLNCCELIGDDGSKFCTLQAILMLTLHDGVYDARARSTLQQLCDAFGFEWKRFAAVELAIAAQLMDLAREAAERVEDEALENAEEQLERQIILKKRKKRQRYIKAAKISSIAIAGGVLFGVTGGLLAPALLSALAGIGLVGAAGLAATGTVASGAVVGSLFGVAGMGLTGNKMRRRMRTKNTDFDFEKRNDPRILMEKRAKELKEQEKKMKKSKKKKKGNNDGVKQDEGNTLTEITREKEENILSNEIQGMSLENEKSTPIDGKGLSENMIKNDVKETSHAGNQITVWNGDGYPKIIADQGVSSSTNQQNLLTDKEASPRASLVTPSLHICLCVPAWLNSKQFGSSIEQFEEALNEFLPCSEGVALRWDPRRLVEMGKAFAKFWASKATMSTIQQVYPVALTAASSVAGAVAAAIAFPLTLTSLCDYIDNPWSVLISRANGAGEELANILSEQSYGKRPVTLVGYSLGARVVFKCLESLAARGARGIVDAAFMLGAPVSGDRHRWEKLSKVVSGRIVNAYCGTDWALAYFHRGLSHGTSVAGLTRVRAKGVEDVNMAFLGVNGHADLRESVTRCFYALGIGSTRLCLPPAPLVKIKATEESSENNANPKDRYEKGSAIPNNAELFDPEAIDKTPGKKNKRKKGKGEEANNLMSDEYKPTGPDDEYWTFDGDFAIGTLKEDDALATFIPEEEIPDKKKEDSENEEEDDLQAMVNVGGLAEVEIEKVKNTLKMSLGLETTGRRVRRFIKRGTEYPVSKTEVFTNCAESQRAMVIRVFEGEHRWVGCKLPRVSSEIDIDKNRLLTFGELNWTQTAPRGSLRILVTFDVNCEGVLRVTAKDSREGGDSLELEVANEALCSIDEKIDYNKKKAAEAESKKKKKDQDKDKTETEDVQEETHKEEVEQEAEDELKMEKAVAMSDGKEGLDKTDSPEGSVEGQVLEDKKVKKKWWSYGSKSESKSKKEKTAAGSYV